MAVRTIGTDIKLTGEKEFNDGMKAINSNLKTLRSDMAATSAVFEDNADSVEALAAKNKILQDSVEQQRVKVDALRQMYEKVAAASGENSAAADKWKQQLNNATAALAKEERALRQNEAALEKSKSAANSAENAVGDLADANSDVARTADRAADELDDMSDKAERTSNILPALASGAGAAMRGLGSLASGALQVGAAAVTMGAAMGTAAITAMVSFAKESAEAAKAAQEAGEALTETQLAWVAYADKLGNLDNAAANAKRALGGVLLPQLSALSKDGAAYLNNFAQSMEEAAGDAEKQAEVLSEYLVEGVKLIKSNFPEYIEAGRTLLSGLKDGFAEVAPELIDDGIDLVFDLMESILDNSDEMCTGGQMLFEKLKAGLEDRGPELLSTAGTLLGELVAGLGNNAADLIPVAGELILAFVGGLNESLPEIGAAAGKMIGELAMWLLDPGTIQAVLDAGLTLGEALAGAIWNALKGAFRGLFNLTEMIGPISGDLDLVLGVGGPGLAIPGYADGLDRVPYDNYLARLHKDEMVLTAAEAARYRNGRGSEKIVPILNLTFNAKTITREDAEMVVDVINEKLGDMIE